MCDYCYGDAINFLPLYFWNGSCVQGYISWATATGMDDPVMEQYDKTISVWGIILIIIK